MSYSGIKFRQNGLERLIVAKKIIIEEVTNGFIVLITNEGNQSVFDSNITIIANDVDQLVGIVKEHAS